MAAPPLLLPRTAPVLLSLVLFSGGKAPTDVPLGLIGVQNDLDLFVQGLIVLGQALGQVLVNRGLGNPNFFAAARTVARFSIMYTASWQALSPM